MTLLVAPCSHEAAKWAVEHWHYSQVLPAGKTIRYGIWEEGRFVGVVLYSRGASPYLGQSLNLDATEICELTRIAMTVHAVAVSSVIARTLRSVKVSNPRLRAVISFADPAEGHHGGIYQAANWVYTGQSNEVTEYKIGGRWRHTRGAYWHPARPTAPTRTAPGKHRYVFPLDRRMRKQIASAALLYPHADEDSRGRRLGSTEEGRVRSPASAPTVSRVRS